MDCCKDKNKSGRKGWIYGVIPHIGCIMFILASILGATALMQFFKPLLMNKYIFHYLVAISLGFATLSAFFYLRKNKSLSKEGIKKNKKYLFTMYGLTLGINLVLFFLVFPFLAGITGNASNIEGDYSSFEISVKIPCPGHAPLITSELSLIEGVKGSDYSFPNKFEVYYSPKEVSQEEILSIEVFEEYPATILSGEVLKEKVVQTNSGTCSGGCGGTQDCGGGCGSPSCSLS